MDWGLRFVFWDYGLGLRVSESFDGVSEMLGKFQNVSEKFQKVSEQFDRFQKSQKGFRMFQTCFGIVS